MVNRLYLNMIIKLYNKNNSYSFSKINIINLYFLFSNTKLCKKFLFYFENFDTLVISK